MVSFSKKKYVSTIDALQTTTNQHIHSIQSNESTKNVWEVDEYKAMNQTTHSYEKDNLPRRRRSQQEQAATNTKQQQRRWSRSDTQERNQNHANKQ